MEMMDKIFTRACLKKLTRGSSCRLRLHWRFPVLLGGIGLAAAGVVAWGMFLLGHRLQPLPNTPAAGWNVGLTLAGAAVVLAAVMIAAAACLLGRLVLEPLSGLRAGLERVGQGDFDYRLPAGGRDEVGQVIDAFNRMAGLLKEHTRQVAVQNNTLAAELKAGKQAQARLQIAYDALQRHNQVLVQILGIGHLLQRNLNPGALFQEVVQAIHYSLGFGIVVLSLLDQDGKQLRVRASVGLGNAGRQMLEDSTYAWEDFAILLQDRFRIGRCYFFPHDGFEARPPDGKGNGNLHANTLTGPWHPDDALLVPIELRPGQIEGIFSVGRPVDGQRPDREILQALEVFASQTATAIENARLYQQVQQDLIDRKRVAEELRRLNEELEDRVRERTMELAKANQTLHIEIAERQRAEELIKASLKEKEMLLQEIHHRVKNNLQVISSLLNLQSSYVDNPEIREIFQESQNRVRSMALVHEKLYRSDDLARIDLADYIRNLASFLFRSYRAGAGHITLNVQADNVFLGIDAAVPCGLILNELISNALKHAFPDKRPGQIRVELRTGPEGAVNLVVADNGIGFPPDFDFTATDSLGMQLVHTLVEQLDGTLEISGREGASFNIKFFIGEPA